MNAFKCYNFLKCSLVCPIPRILCLHFLQNSSPQTLLQDEHLVGVDGIFGCELRTVIAGGLMETKITSWLNFLQAKPHF